MANSRAISNDQLDTMDCSVICMGCGLDLTTTPSCNVFAILYNANLWRWKNFADAQVTLNSLENSF